MRLDAKKEEGTFQRWGTIQCYGQNEALVQMFNFWLLLKLGPLAISQVHNTISSFVLYKGEGRGITGET